MSQLLFRTLREAPQDAEVESHKLLARASYIYRLSSGVYNYLPLGQRVLNKINSIIRSKLDSVGAQEMFMSVLQPVDIWDESGRSADFGALLPAFQLEGRSGHYVLGPTHEEVATRIVSTYAKSYKDLPVTIYQIQTKFRDEARPRFGLLRTKELIMCDAYSFDVSKEKMVDSYEKLRIAYDQIFKELDLEVTPVEAKSGAIGGDVNHEYMVPSPIGEDTFVSCFSCGYSANTEIAKKRNLSQEEIDSINKSITERFNTLIPEEVLTPGDGSIEEVAGTLNLKDSKESFLKTYVLKDKEDKTKTVFIVVNGDRQIKVPNELEAFEKEDFLNSGLIKGFVSPYNLDPNFNVKVICDYEILKVPESGYVVGANKENYHVTNVVPFKDFKIDEFADVASVQSGDSCPKCNSSLTLIRSVEAAHTFQIGLKYSNAMKNAEFLDSDGGTKPYYMGCYGIGVSRLLAVIAEKHHDSDGLIWPSAVSPFDVVIVPLLASKDDRVKMTANRVYEDLSQICDVLFDDRELSPGVSLADADLIGITLRVVISPKTLISECAEVKDRRTGSIELVKLEVLAQHLSSLLVE
jgi:prolyl-tRNA synthetase